jgi:hypothetical protein
MTTTDTKRITTQTATHLIQRRAGGWFITDGPTIIALGHMTIVEAARLAHDYKRTMAD